MKQIVSNEKWSIKYSWPYVYIFMLPTILSFMQLLRAIFFLLRKKYQLTFVAVANKVATKKKIYVKRSSGYFENCYQFFFLCNYFPSCSLPGLNNSKNVRFAFINLAAWGEAQRKKSNKQMQPKRMKDEKNK